MRFIRKFLIIQAIKENRLIIDIAMFGFLLSGSISGLLGKRARAFGLLSQAHRTTRTKWMKTIVEPWIASNLSLHFSVQKNNVDLDMVKSFLGTRIMVIKPYISSSEQGVLLVMYSEVMPLIPAFFRVDELLKKYKLVFEPSWSGFCTSDILHFTKYKQNIYFLSKQIDDYRFLTAIDKNLIPINLGPCDWVDPDVAKPFVDEEKKFDLVMNSNWGAWKRHHALFKALAKMKRKISVALIGFEWGGQTKQNIEEVARYYGVFDQLSFFENINFSDVMKITCQSRVAVLLSLKEGSNRAIAEAIFCNVPSIVLVNHVGGIVNNIVPETGQLVCESELANTIENMCSNLDSYQPRAWAQNNISCLKSAAYLNEELKCYAEKDGENWTTDIAIRASSPESTYYYRDDIAKFSQLNKQLESFLK
jgi:glycosyltransferase involved in cell wall biosynthesis